MGGLFARSSVQGDRKMKRDKQKRQRQQLEVSFEPEAYLIPDRNENEDSSIDFINTYESWETNFEPQQIMNMNDPPGAPSTYSANQSDITNQSWSSPPHSFYPINPLRMTPPYNGSYIQNQFNQAQIPDTINNQSKTIILEERPSKKVQFSASNQHHHQQQQQTSNFKPLTNTQSWHESSGMSAPLATKSLPLSTRSSLPRTSVLTSKTSSARTPIEKPIYIGVDFQATLAERGQINGNKRHRRNGEKSHSDGLNSSANNHRTRSHTNHQHKHQTPTGSPGSNIETIINKSIDFQRIRTNSPASNRLLQNNEIKPTKSRSHRRQQPSMNNEIKPSKNRENHRRHHQEQHSSPSNIQPSTRKLEPKQSGTPVMRIPLSQLNHQHQRQPIVLSSTTKITKVNRTLI